MKLGKEELLSILKEEVSKYFNEEESAASLVRELIFFIEKSPDLSKKKKSIERNLLKRIKNNDYETEKATSLWNSLINDASADFIEDAGVTGMKWYELFPKTIRREAAVEAAENFEREVSSSNVKEACGKKHVKKEVAPPGGEKQVKALKKTLPKTYKDDSGKRKESNPYAIAWAQYKKNKGKK